MLDGVMFFYSKSSDKKKEIVYNLMSYTEEYCGDPEGTAETVGKLESNEMMVTPLSL